MIASTEYEVYYSENGNPKQTEESIANGAIEPIEKNETAKLSFQADKAGVYMFKVFQSPGYKDNYEQRQEIWSEKVMVKCVDKEDKKEEAERLDEPASEENIDPNNKDSKDKEGFEEPSNQTTEETEVVEEIQIEKPPENGKIQVKTNDSELVDKPITEINSENTNEEKVEESKSKENVSSNNNKESHIISESKQDGELQNDN